MESSAENTKIIITGEKNNICTYNLIRDGWLSHSPPMTIIPFNFIFPVNLKNIYNFKNLT